MKQINRLDSEKSLYLKQHADNPVFWYPWGDEAFAEAERLNKPIIKAISICSEKDVDLSETFKPFCEMILFDTKLQTPEIRGGSGISFNWNLLEKYKSKKKWMLAGGLNIKNLKKAVELTGAPIVDISSGVEVEKGVKCPKKIKELIRYVKKSGFTKI